MIYADVIVDISHENLDKTYQYKVKPSQEKFAVIGAPVTIPFGRGNRLIKGYIVGISTIPKWEESKMKELDSVVESGVVIESQLIHLAWWIKEHYGSTMNDALKTVIPVKKAVKKKEKKYVRLTAQREEAEAALKEYRRKKNKGRVRLLEALLEDGVLDWNIVTDKLAISRSTLEGVVEAGLAAVDRQTVSRNPHMAAEEEKRRFVLNEEQKTAVDGIVSDYKKGVRRTYLIHGVTGSGKTEVYLSIIEKVLEEGRQVIMLIPEIALTYQTVMRFYRRFGEAVSILNSRMSQGERFDQYERAKKGEVSIMIGPRSALFTPFPNLGLIVVDEEHEGSYKSESVPKYHARETAVMRAQLAGASVVLGSATPSVESYQKALRGRYQMYTLKNRAGAGRLPRVEIVDLREELKKKNRSIFSGLLREGIKARLLRKEQVILFINRRGYAGFVSCRSCGLVIKCPHCDISLTVHKNGSLICHYCGHEQAMPRGCPQCGSPFIAAFGTGTQKIEEQVRKEFQEARVLRMDMDTTKGREGHEKILSAFVNQEADILVGTQMIVKGHDFPNVTLVGILAADLSLYAGNYRAAETTYELLAQAAGRAGRGERAGEVVIQTYNPEHYSIRYAAENDYQSFYQQEMAYRELLSYPPAGHITAILITSALEKALLKAAELLGGVLREKAREYPSVSIVGPAKASVSKISDVYRQVIYMKDCREENLKELKDYLEGYLSFSGYMKDITVQFDLDPMMGY